jgi:hypothetical protein
MKGQGEGGPIISNIVLPASMAILAVLFNISMLVVTARKMYVCCRVYFQDAITIDNLIIV